jgi:hypothetical protein
MGKVGVEEMAIDSTLIEAKKWGEGVGIDGHKKRGVPFSIALGPGDEHDSRKLDEIGRFEAAPSDSSDD